MFGFRRRLSAHVVTRWYRAPEVILCSQRREYVTAIDMWSLGCIFAEILALTQDNREQQIEPLFPGKTSFPLSAMKPDAYKDEKDQLNVIFDVIGSPTDEEISKISHVRGQELLQLLNKAKLKKAINFGTKYPQCDESAIDLLKKLLTFDVEKRITVENALNHEYFASCRELDAEAKLPASKFEFEDIDVDIGTLKQLIVEELKLYSKH